MSIQKKFGKQVRELRIEKGWSQEKLANIAGIDRTYIPGIEQGNRNVSLAIIEKLSKAFKISISEFFNLFN
jgi:transcriptional regulator with XRE-family HTH domain